MSDFNFEEYRQPWETGPHWELKREFIEKYRNDFPEDRLLCLAQAYSNIELLQCSYPDPVMLQIHELSKPLIACRVFHDMAKNSKSPVQNTSKAQRGKRKLLESSSESSKYIKFCPAEEQPMISLDTSESVRVKTEKNSVESDDSSCAVNGVNIKAEILSPKQLNRQDDVKDLNASDVCSSVNDINQDPTKKCLAVNSSLHYRIADSIGANVFQEFINAIRKFLVKGRGVLEAIQCSAQIAKIQSSVVYSMSVDATTKKHASQFICSLFIKGILVSFAKESSKKKAKLEASKLAVDKLLNHSDAGLSGFDDLEDNSGSPPKDSVGPEQSSVVDLAQSCIVSFAQLSHGSKETEHPLPSVGPLPYADSPPPPQSELVPGDDVSRETQTSLAGVPCPSHDRRIGPKPCVGSPSCADSPPSPPSEWPPGDDVSKESQTIGVPGPSRDRRTGPKAPDVAFIYSFKEALRKELDVLESVASIKIGFRRAAKSLRIPLSFYCRLNPHGPQKQKYSVEVFLKDILISSHSYLSKSRARFLAVRAAIDFLLNTSDFVIKIHNGRKYLEPLTENEYLLQNSVPTNSGDVPQFPTLNRNLLNNSLRLQFVLLDRIDTEGNPIALLQNSANFCQMRLTFEYQRDDSNSKVDVMLQGRFVCSGSAQGRAEAKKMACALAVEKFRKMVYTIKVAKEDPKGFVVQRNQLLDSTASLSSTDNIGCKMLKNMGWTGGSIGNSPGIVEPIVPQGHSFGRGLGYGANDLKSQNFRRKIDALLQDFSRSNNFEDLIFSTEFSKEERKQIHQVAVKYNLQSVSRGVDEERYLTVRRKLKMPELLEHLVKAGGRISKYTLYDASNHA